MNKYEMIERIFINANKEVILENLIISLKEYEKIFIENEYIQKENRNLKEEIVSLGEMINSFKKEYEAINATDNIKKMVADFSKVKPIILNKESIEPKKNILTVNVKATEIDEVKNIIASFIFMLEDSRIDKDIRLQYLESCKELKDYYVRIDK